MSDYRLQRLQALLVEALALADDLELHVVGALVAESLERLSEKSPA